MVHFSQIPIVEATVRVRKLNQLSALIMIMRPASRRQRRKLAALAGTRSAPGGAWYPRIPSGPQEGRGAGAGRPKVPL